MSLNTALEFASRGYAVLPVGPDKRPRGHHIHKSTKANLLPNPSTNANGASVGSAQGSGVVQRGRFEAERA
jgi:hypothetical protein